jgi:hypothetical protein
MPKYLYLCLFQSNMKMNRKIIPCILIAFFIVGASLAALPHDKLKREQRKLERKARDKYLGLGMGGSYIKVIDNATSPLLYRGLTIPFVSLGYLTHSEKIIKTFEADFSFGELKSRTETPWYDQRNTSLWIAFRYNHLFRVRHFAKPAINWYLGPEINTNAHLRVNYKYENSAFTFDNYNGIGFSSRIELPFGYKAAAFKFLFMNLKRRDRNLWLSWQLSVPVVSWMLRPTYVTITNFVDPELQSAVTTDHTDGGLFVPMNIRSQTELFYELHNGNLFKLAYIWNFYHHDPGYNKVQSAFHAVCFSFVFKFNQN